MNYESELKFSAQVLFVVPKKLFRKAHERNLLKRRMREAYRLSKQNFYSQIDGKKKLLAFVYNSKKTESYPVVQKGIQQGLLAIISKTNA